MPRKKKGELPSGSIRVQVYIGTDESGKRKYKSFTAPTKVEAQAMADEWKTNRRTLKNALTVSVACERYIELKEGVLSPYTVMGYRSALRRLDNYALSKMSMDRVRNTDVQFFVSELAKNVSPKTVSNTFGLISSAFKMFLPDMQLHVTLPAKQKQQMYIPNSQEVQKLLDSCQTTEVKLAVLFAAIGTMRRGETCAVKFSDVDFKNNTISVNKSYVKIGSVWELKAPKTFESNRTIRFPEYVIDMIKSLKRTSGFIIDLNPDQLSDRFTIALKRSQLPHFRYHDLRHYAASAMHANGVPERYIEAIGGWKPGSNVLKRVYENVLDTELERIEKSMSEKHRFEV